MTANEPQTAPPPNKLRRHRLTPDRLVLGLLAVEGFLLLSEQFRWFAFNGHKGWTVLVAVATVGLTLLLMFLWFLAALVFRCRFQYGLRSLLLLVLAVAVACSWVATERRRVGEQRRLVKALGEALGEARGYVGYDYELDAVESTIGRPGEAVHYDYQDDAGARPGHWRPPGPEWLRSLVGDDFFTTVVCVYLDGTGYCVDDALANVAGLRQLRSLNLRDAQVTDAGLACLHGLTQLEWLGLGNTHVTDAGLVHIEGLSKLRGLVLRKTQVTDAGLAHLKNLNCIEGLDLRDTEVTDAGMVHLQGLKQLQWVHLKGTKVTDGGRRKLQRALPNCRFWSD